MTAAQKNLPYGKDLKHKVFLIADYGGTPTSIDITPTVSEFHLRESLYYPTMEIQLSVLETTGIILSELPATGQEIIILELYSNFGYRKRYTFRLTKVESPLSLQEKSYALNVFGVSPELEINLNTKVYDFFKGKTGSQIVTAIYNKHLKSSLSNKKLIAEPSSNLLTFTGAGHTPLEYIQMVAADTQSQQYPESSTFLFYETKEAFYFRSLNNILSQKPVTSLYYADPGTQMGPDGRNYIAGITWHNNVDALKGLGNGFYSNTVSAIDVITKTFNTYTFNYVKDFNKLTHVTGGGKPLVRSKSFGGGALGDSLNGAAHYRMIATDFNTDIKNQTIDGRISDSNDPHKFHSSTKHNFLPKRIAQMTALQQVRLDVTTSILPYVQAGDIINIFIPNNVGEGQSVAERYFKYWGQRNPTFVVVGHTISFNGKDGTMFSTFHCSKESFGIGLASSAASSASKPLAPLMQSIEQVATNTGQNIIENLLPTGITDFFKNIGKKLGG